MSDIIRAVVRLLFKHLTKLIDGINVGHPISNSFNFGVDAECIHKCSIDMILGKYSFERERTMHTTGTG